MIGEDICEVKLLNKFVDIVSERKIRAAIESGELKNLPGAGKPVTIENFYFLPPEFKFAYTVLKNGGYLNLADDDKPPVSLTCNSKNLPNEHLSNSIKTVHETTSESLIGVEMDSSNAKPINNTECFQEKALGFNIIRDCRRGRY